VWLDGRSERGEAGCLAYEYGTVLRRIVHAYRESIVPLGNRQLFHPLLCRMLLEPLLSLPLTVLLCPGLPAHDVLSAGIGILVRHGFECRSNRTDAYASALSAAATS
jgi:hypothetical protein